MAKKEKAAEQGSDPNAWMLTFSDLVTLLLTFFVMLLSMSTMDVQRVQKIISSFTAGSGVLEFTQFGRLDPMAERLRALNRLNLDQLPKDDILLDIFLGKGDPQATALFENLKANVRIRRSDKELALIFGAQFLFRPGSTEMEPKADPILKRLAQIINQIDRPVSIEGHSDSTPVKTGGRYDSNWDISLARSLAVRNSLVDRFQANPYRIRVAAMGSARPLAENKTPEGRALNRRIEVVFQWQQ